MQWQELAYGFALTVPTPAFSENAAAIYRQSAEGHGHARPVIPLNATALAPATFFFGTLFGDLSGPAAYSQPGVRETDTLSRNVDDCNYGCIDNGR